VSRPASIAAAAGWIGLVLLLFWQEFFVEAKWHTAWWFRIPATLAFGLVILVFAVECLVQEMTVRRWAVSVVVFVVFAVILLLAGIFNPDTIHLPRWMLFPVSALYLAGAAVSAAGARDSL
jgi:hypothetical protein